MEMGEDEKVDVERKRRMKMSYTKMRECRWKREEVLMGDEDIEVKEKDVEEEEDGRQREEEQKG